jgi:hypothetical protein
VERVDDEYDLIYFTDGSVVQLCGRDAELEINSAEHYAAMISDRKRAKDIMDRAWRENNAAYDNPEKVSAGWGGFYRLPDAEPWPDWEADVRWLDSYNDNGRSSFEPPTITRETFTDSFRASLARVHGESA